MPVRRILCPAAALMITLTAACHSKPPEAAPAAAPAPPTAAPDAGNQQRVRDSIMRAQAARAAALAQRMRDDSIARANAAARDQAGMRTAIVSMIHFDFDRSELRDDAVAILDAKIPVLIANPGITIRIAGHTDEKGSAEYNLALGQRRAAAAKRYLKEHGVADTRIETVSYGMERPLALGKDEAAMAQNRRDEFEITAGGAGVLNKPRF